jgi:hypothetical protein
MRSRTVSASLCITGESMMQAIRSNLDDKFIFAFSASGSSKILSEGRGWCEISEMTEERMASCYYLFLVPRKVLIQYKTLLAGFIDGPEDSNDPAGWPELLSVGGIFLPLGYLGKSSLISTSYLLRYRVLEAQAIGALECYKAFRRDLLRICSRSAGIGQFPAFPYTLERIRFEPGLEDFISKDYDFVEFLK